MCVCVWRKLVSVMFGFLRSRHTDVVQREWLYASGSLNKYQGLCSRTVNRAEPPSLQQAPTSTLLGHIPHLLLLLLFLDSHSGLNQTVFSRQSEHSSRFVVMLLNDTSDRYCHGNTDERPTTSGKSQAQTTWSGCPTSIPGAGFPVRLPLWASACVHPEEFLIPLMWKHSLLPELWVKRWVAR